jgi:hypothetical protein
MKTFVKNLENETVEISENGKIIATVPFSESAGEVEYANDTELAEIMTEY